MNHPKIDSSKGLVDGTDSSTKKVTFLSSHEKIKAFPLKLMEVLSNDDHSDVISWLEHGGSFMIYKRDKFVTSVMPKYFKQTKFESFMRKLSRWGFRKEKRGPVIGAYYHYLFKRDNPRLCLQMNSLQNKHTESIFKRGYIQEQILNPVNNTDNPSHRIKGELLLRNLRLQRKLQSDLFEERLLELLLLKRRHREKTELRNSSVLTDRSLLSIRADAIRENLMRKASQCLPINNVADAIPSQTRWSRKEALRAPMDNESGRTAQKGILRNSNRHSPNIFPDYTDLSQSSSLGWHDLKEYNDILREEMSIADYL